MAKKKATKRKQVLVKREIKPVHLNGALSKLGLRLPHGYAIAKRKRK